MRLPTGIMQALPFAFFKMNAVTKYGALADQTVVIVNIQIAFALRKKFVYPRNFVGVFRDMCLHVRLREFAPQCAGSFELCR